MPNIKLQSSDGETFEVDVEIAKQSVTIKTMLEGMCIHDSDIISLFVCKTLVFLLIDRLDDFQTFKMHLIV